MFVLLVTDWPRLCTLLRAVLELPHPFTDAFLSMPSSHLFLLWCCQFFPLPLSQYCTCLICYYYCWFSYLDTTLDVASFVVYPHFHHSLAGNFFVAESTLLLSSMPNSEPGVNGYLWLILTTNTSLLPLVRCVIPLFLCLWQQPFTCSVLLCRCEDLLYGCITLSATPSIVTAVTRLPIVYYTFPLLAVTLIVVRFIALLPASCIYKQSRGPLSLPLLSPRCSTDNYYYQLDDGPHPCHNPCTPALAFHPLAPNFYSVRLVMYLISLSMLS